MASSEKQSIGRPRAIGLAALILILSGVFAAHAQQSPATQRGLVFVRANCAQCHSVDKVSVSPLTIAPPFRTLHLKYPLDDLRESLSEGIMTGHPTMPQFRLDPGQVDDVISYLKSLER
jgi:cytochrome c